MHKHQINPGTILILDKSSATGGVHYHHKSESARKPVNSGAGYKQDYARTKVVDHVALVAESDSYVQSARYILRCNATNTELGWVASPAAWARIQNGWTDERGKEHTGIKHLIAQARSFNQRAARSGSQRRVSVSLVDIELGIDNKAAAQHIAATVRGVCEDFVRELRAGNVDKLAPIFLRSKNLEELGVGDHRAVIEYAIENAREARTELRKAKKAGDDMATAGAALDLESLEGCAAIFGDWSIDALQDDTEAA